MWFYVPVTPTLGVRTGVGVVGVVGVVVKGGGSSYILSLRPVELLEILP